MYKYHCLNPISEVGLDQLDENYVVTGNAEEADAILIGDNFQVGGVHHLHRVGEVGHQVGDVEAVLGDFFRDALHNVLRQNQGLVPVDHDIQVGLHTAGDLPQPFGGGLAVRGGHDHAGAESLRHRFNLLAVGGDVDLIKAGHLLAVLPHPVDHGMAADIRKGFVVISRRPAPGGDHTDDFHLRLSLL